MVQTQDGEATAASTGVLGAGRRPAPSQRHCSTLDAHKTRDVCVLEKWSASVQKAGSTGEPGSPFPVPPRPTPQFQQQSFGTGLVFKGIKKTVNIPLGECVEPLTARLPMRCVCTEEQWLQL